MASKEHGMSGKRKYKTKATEENNRLVKILKRAWVHQPSAQPHVDWQSTKNTVSERTRHMFNNSDMSDISFTCEGSDKMFYAHKYILATSSAVFKAMFYGDLAEKNSTLRLSDTDEISLEECLRFLYTDECNWTSLTIENAVSIMYLSKKYIVPSLTEECVKFLEGETEPNNVLYILEQAIHFDEKHLEIKSWDFIDWNTEDIVELECFNLISHKSLACLLKRDSLDIKEVELFKAVLKWIDYQCSQKGLDTTRENRRFVIGDAIYDLRFLAMREDGFAKYVATSGLLTAEEIVSIYNKFNNIESPDLKWKLLRSRINNEKSRARILALQSQLKHLRRQNKLMLAGL
jgi:BTB/POZ domain-containing protein 3/6